MWRGQNTQFIVLLILFQYSRFQHVGCFAIFTLLIFLTFCSVNISTHCTGFVCCWLQEVDLFCFWYMLEAAAAFLSHQLQWQALLPLPLCPSYFTFHFSLPSSLPWYHLFSPILFVSFLIPSCPQPHSLCLCLVPIFPSLPTQSALSVCKMIAALELLPTPGALMKAVLRWKQG